MHEEVFTKKIEEKLWWQTGIIYEIYVRSFQDSNDDGIGDLRGILKRLDYLEWLGVTALWLTPVYPSPMKDFGYDISDYTGIHPVFGKMDDFDELISEVHRRGMKLIIDFVPNHTSDQHPWFLESRSSKNNPKRDWYYWKDAGPGGQPPNNWLAVLGGSAWEWDELTKQYYYHAFLKEQPDLNLRNPEVQKAIMDIMRFWLGKGVDGFRIDVMWHLAKDEKWRDNPANPHYQPHMPTCDQVLQIYSCDQPEARDIVSLFRELLDTYSQKLLIGELYLPIDKVVGYYGAGNKGAHLPGNFQLLFLPWQAGELGIAIDQYEGVLPDVAWPNWIIGNHDRPRLISRIGREQTCNAAMLLLTLRGTPTLYYGDEIGMQQVRIPDSEVQDPQGLLMPGKNLSRDGGRTPMQWDGTEGAGFSKHKPWMRLDEQYRENNVAEQKEDPDSLLNFYHRLIHIRQSEPSLNMGDYYPIITDGKVLSYMRKAEGADSFLVILNLTNEAQKFVPVRTEFCGSIVLSTKRNGEGEQLEYGRLLQPDEGLLVRLESTE